MVLFHTLLPLILFLSCFGSNRKRKFYAGPQSEYYPVHIIANLKAVSVVSVASFRSGVECENGISQYLSCFSPGVRLKPVAGCLTCGSGRGAIAIARAGTHAGNAFGGQCEYADTGART